MREAVLAADQRPAFTLMSADAAELARRLPLRPAEHLGAVRVIDNGHGAVSVHRIDVALGIALTPADVGQAARIADQVRRQQRDVGGLP
ncbi:hypothetical protein D3C73_1394900 [compost metagenome]